MKTEAIKLGNAFTELQLAGKVRMLYQSKAVVFMKYLGVISAWAVVMGVGLLGLNARHIVKADPTDDFSFSMTHAPEGGAYRLMSESRVAKILGDRLSQYPKSEIRALAHHIVGLCRKYRFDPAFVLSMIQVESSFKVSAVSPVGAIGLMQLMPATAQHIAKKHGIRYAGSHALHDPFTNISLGIAYLSMLRERYRGYSPYFHIAAYNIGPAKLDSLKSKKGFKPSKTRKYYEDIIRGVPHLRDYQQKSAGRDQKDQRA